jgi:hypothetical protein
MLKEACGFLHADRCPSSVPRKGATRFRSLIRSRSRVSRDRELPQDHPGRPIVMRRIPANPVRRGALTQHTRSECLMTIRAGFLLAGTTVNIMARHLGRERRRPGQYDDRNHKQFGHAFETHPGHNGTPFRFTTIRADRVCPRSVLCPAIVPTEISDWYDLHR